MEMPTPCEHCGTTFDLYDGYASEKWHEGIVICSSCHEEEEKEMEEDDRWETINLDLSNSLYGLEKESLLLEKLDKQNKDQILQVAKLLQEKIPKEKSSEEVKGPEMLEMLKKMVFDFEQTSKSSSDILMEYLGKAKCLIKEATELEV